MKDKEKRSNRKSKKVYIICLCVFIIAILTLCTYCVTRANTSTVYPNINIAGINVGNMTQNQVKDVLKEKLSSQNTLKFHYNDTNFEISGDEISFYIDVEKTAENAINTGKGGNIIKKSVSFLKHTIIPGSSEVCVNYDKDKLMLILSGYLGDNLKDMVPYTVTEGEDCLIINNGASGTAIDFDRLDSLIKNDANDLNMNLNIAIDLKTVNPEKIDADKFYKEYNREVKDASYTEKDGNYEFEKEQNGIELNYEEVVKIIEENRNNTKDYTIPAIITKAEITVESLEKKLISRVISSYTTSFASSDANRAHNVMLAASKIDGVILNPGDSFSYNKIVGPRTYATGFKNAHVYEGTKIVDGMGGGICQVSSTLYNSVLMADLKIIKRTNHSMPVGYVPMGRDATVSYGTIDFVFQNDKNFPVKISAYSQNRILTISIEGVSDIDYTVDLYTQVVSTKEFTTQEVPTQALAPGETRVIQNGSNGATVYTYKIYKRNGVQFDKKQVAKSVYNPIEKIIEVGYTPIEETPVQTTPDEDNTSDTENPPPNDQNHENQVPEDEQIQNVEKEEQADIKENMNENLEDEGVGPSMNDMHAEGTPSIDLDAEDLVQ